MTNTEWQKNRWFTVDVVNRTYETMEVSVYLKVSDNAGCVLRRSETFWVALSRVEFTPTDETKGVLKMPFKVAQEKGISFLQLSRGAVADQMTLAEEYAGMQRRTILFRTAVRKPAECLAGVRF